MYAKIRADLQLNLDKRGYQPGVKIHATVSVDASEFLVINRGRIELIRSEEESDGWRANVYDEVNFAIPSEGR